MGVASLVTVLQNCLYLKNAQMEQADFFNASANSGKLKVVGVIKSGYDLLIHETVKSALL